MLEMFKSKPKALAKSGEAESDAAKDGGDEKGSAP
jgi:hypothetical protein